MYSKMNHYLADLAVLNIKLHNLHWNVVGIHFKPLHVMTEELYDKLFESFDEVAEMLKIRGLRPAASMREYLELTCIEELPSDKDFTTKDVLNVLVSDLETLKKQAVEIRKLADEADDFNVVAYFEDQVEEIAKTLWFLDSMQR